MLLWAGILFNTPILRLVSRGLDACTRWNAEIVYTLPYALDSQVPKTGQGCGGEIISVQPNLQERPAQNLVALHRLLYEVNQFLAVLDNEVFKRASRREVERGIGWGTMDEFQDDGPGQCWLFVDEIVEGIVSPRANLFPDSE